MFRQPAVRLRQVASPLFNRGGLRMRTTASRQTTESSHGSKPFWTTGRVLLLSAFTGTATYLYGTNNDAPKLPFSKHQPYTPCYASKKELEKVGCNKDRARQERR
jgi:D-lactate dehydrogenase (cytochrome)